MTAPATAPQKTGRRAGRTRTSTTPQPTEIPKCTGRAARTSTPRRCSLGKSTSPAATAARNGSLPRTTAQTVEGTPPTTPPTTPARTPTQPTPKSLRQSPPNATAEEGESRREPNGERAKAKGRQ